MRPLVVRQIDFDLAVLQPALFVTGSKLICAHGLSLDTAGRVDNLGLDTLDPLLWKIEGLDQHVFVWQSRAETYNVLLFDVDDLWGTGNNSLTDETLFKTMLAMARTKMSKYQVVAKDIEPTHRAISKLEDCEGPVFGIGIVYVNGITGVVDTL